MDIDILAASYPQQVSFVFIFVFWGLLWGAVCVIIGQKKNLSAGGSFAWGFFLGLIGVIIVAAKAPELPSAPDGLRAIKCPRCNMVQNVPYNAPTFDCWQCHLVTPLLGATAPSSYAANAATNDASPVTHETSPVTHETSPVTHETSPVTHHTPPPVNTDNHTIKARCLFCGNFQTVWASQTEYVCEQCGRNVNRNIHIG